MSVTAAVKGSLTITDNLTGSTSFSKVLNNSFTGDLSIIGQQVIIGTTPVVVGLPNNLAEYVYVKNLSATQGTTLTVTWTPNTGTNATVITLDPGAMIMFCEGTTTNGISAMSLVSNQQGTFVEYLLAG